MHLNVNIRDNFIQHFIMGSFWAEQIWSFKDVYSDCGHLLHSNRQLWKVPPKHKLQQSNCNSPRDLDHYVQWGPYFRDLLGPYLIDVWFTIRSVFLISWVLYRFGHNV